LIPHRIAPGASIQDKGRPGYLAEGLSVSGAIDRAALAEGAALLGQPGQVAALELPGMGGEFEASEDMRIALTGAPMRATLDGRSLAWNACHLLPKGPRLVIGAPREGIYGYLHVGGGFATPLRLGSRSSHLGAGLGTAIEPGAPLPVGPDPRPGQTGLALPGGDRFSGGTVRVVRGPQTELFEKTEIERFEATPFERDPRSNRMGARLAFEGDGFHTGTGLAILSEIIRPGDIQITGDGTPFVLLAECQTTGGYPRIGSVLPADMARVAQAGPGRALRFRFLDMPEALTAERAARTTLDRLASACHPLVRDPRDMTDLLSYQLIGGATAGDDLGGLTHD
jgi:allophanate hydrolase